MRYGIGGVRAALAALALLAVTGCAGVGMADVLGGMGGVGMPGGNGELRGEIGRVDSRSRQVEVRSGWGHSTRVQYARNTQVIYGQRRYSVRDLERGDVVSMRVQRDRRGGLYTDRIYVERSAGRSGGQPGRYPDADRRGEARGRVQSFSGDVTRIDHRAGWFQLRSRDASVTVTLPDRASRSVQDRFRRLRRGDRTRVEAAWVGPGRVELRRFR